MELGMSRSLGLMAVSDNRENVFLGQELGQARTYSEETAREIDNETKQMLDDAYNRALDILRKKREGLDRVAAELLEKEEISGKRVLELLGISKPIVQEQMAQVT